MCAYSNGTDETDGFESVSPLPTSVLHRKETRLAEVGNLAVHLLISAPTGVHPVIILLVTLPVIDDIACLGGCGGREEEEGGEERRGARKCGQDWKWRLPSLCVCNVAAGTNHKVSQKRSLSLKYECFEVRWERTKK